MPLAGLLALLLLATACSTRKNTAASRRWHAFTARYNTYFNGQQAFLEGENAKLAGHKDNFTELLPVFLVGSEKSRQTGKANFETAVTKCRKAIALPSIQRKPQARAAGKMSPKEKLYRQRREFNPFLKHAWLLMGQAQFESGEFLEAAATFSYITRHYAAEPAVAAEARQWMARCYAAVGWHYDAEEALRRMAADSLPKRVALEADATRADLLLRQERFEEALPYLRRAARGAKGSQRRARLYFLEGQVCQRLGRADDAYKALARCIRQSPPFDLAFNARILQTEVMATGPKQSRAMLAKLRRMARNENNKDYLDQVYYAMGNIHLQLADTAAAVAAYEKGREKSVRNGLEKGGLLLRLGEIYWDRRRFLLAQGCYTEAIGLIDKDRRDYAEIERRSKVLDKLVPFTEAVLLQDSLQWLATPSEEERNAAIDRTIEALRQREKAEREARLDSAAEARALANADNGLPRDNRQQNKLQPQQQGQQQTWYFYNQMLVIQGRQDFQKRWGKRPNEDNWRRSNRTVVSDFAEEEGENADSLAGLPADSLAAEEPADSAALDPHERAYYLAQIPFTEEARAASDAIIQDGLFNAGIIEKDDLEDFPLAAETLNRLTSQYKGFDRLAEAYYHLFLLYSRWGRPAEAEEARSQMALLYPDHELTRLVTAPDFEHTARYGREIEDSLYAATYRAYRLRDTLSVSRNFQISTEKYPSGLNRPKFIFVHALSRLATAPRQELLTELRDLLSQFPESDVSPMAGMIVKGLESGRQFGSGTFDLGSLWDRRTASADSLAQGLTEGAAFTAERHAPFLFVLAYPTDSLDDRRLLYEMAHFNFATFVVRGFDMEVVRDREISQFRVAGFGSYDEAHAYARRLYADKSLQPFLQKGRTLLISAHNLALLGVQLSYNDYQLFFEQHFVPLDLPDNLPVEQAAPPVEQHYEDEYSPEELERLQQGGANDNGEDDGGDWY